MIETILHNAYILLIFIGFLVLIKVSTWAIRKGWEQGKDKESFWKGLSLFN